MKTEDKMELTIAIVFGAISVFIFISDIPKLLASAGLSFSITFCFFFTLSFGQRRFRKNINLENER